MQPRPDHTVGPEVLDLTRARSRGVATVWGRSTRPRHKGEVLATIVKAATAAIVPFLLLLAIGTSRLAAESFDTLYAFGGDDGVGPNGLIEASDGAVYGTTGGGGAHASGVVFKLNMDGTGFVNLHDFDIFDAANGGYPQAGLIEASDGALYGTTYLGGANNAGVVFKIDKDGTDFLNVHDFNGSDGMSPYAALIEASDGALYGTTNSGGANGYGTVFRLNKDGTGFLKLHDFDGIDGAFALAALVEASDGALYGTASIGGLPGFGVVFKLNKDGTGFLRIHDFDGSDGYSPSAALIEASDGALYGTTSGGGLTGSGVVFVLNKDGSGFLKLHDFDGSDGRYCVAGLVEASDGALYGTTFWGGLTDSGVVFRLNKDGTGFLKLHDFSGSEGSRPGAALLEGSDDALYGTTFYGGPADDGVVFRLIIKCEASVQVQGKVNSPGTRVPVQVHIAHHRPKTVTVRWELSLLDASDQVIAKHISAPHTFEPGDVLDQEVQFQLPDDLASGEYTLELAIRQMAGTKGARTTLRIVQASRTSLQRTP